MRLRYDTYMKLFSESSSLLYKVRRAAIPFLIIVLFFSFRLPRLGYDLSNADAIRWHSRSEHFLNALKIGDLVQTYQHYQPGVTLMWLSAGIKQVTQTYQLRGNADYFPIIERNTRSVLVIILAFLLVFQAYFVSKLFGYSTSLYYMFLMAVEPYLIGIDRWFHLTSLETYLAFASFLALFYWCKSRKTLFFYLSAVAFGLGVLTKLTTIATVPVLVALIVYYGHKEKRSFVNVLKSLVIFGITSLAVFVALFPAMWVQPLYVIEKLLADGTQAVQSASSGEITLPNFYGLNPLLYYIVVLGLKLSPITLALGLFSAFKIKKIQNQPFVPLYFLVAFLVFTIANKKIDRYAIFLFPSLLLMIASVLNTLRFKYIILFAAFLFIVWTSYIYFPIYSAYYSPLFGGTMGAQKVGVYNNNGEYFANAAFYLNKLSRDTVVFVPGNAQTFTPFFKGKTVGKFGSTVDYVVSSVDLYRGSPNSGLCPTLDKSFGPRDTKIVFVYRCKY